MRGASREGRAASGFAGIAAVAAIAVFALACSCAMRTVNALAWLSSDPTRRVSISVQVEGEDGDCLSGCLVHALAPSGELAVLEFDSSRSRYIGAFEGATSGTYRIVVRAYGDSVLTTLDVPHVVIAARPLVVSVMDGAGTNGLAGNQLDGGLPVTVAWEAVPGADAYLVKANGPNSGAWAGTSGIPSVTIPPGSLAVAGNYAFSVLAQYSSGDPLLYAAPYSSTSSAQGPAAYCGVR